jgi:hypothetical protein
MTFEMLRMMVQEYADQHKEPAQLPAVIDTISVAYQRICQGEDAWTALGDFSNAWYGYGKHIRPDLIREPLPQSDQQTDVTRRWAAFCAASVEYLCDLHQQPCPAWVHASSYHLDTPWWYALRADDPEIRIHLQQMTPTPFLKRNIYCGNRIYQNKYERYEWIQEAINEGITDLHTIQSYARQRERSLYGA